MNVCCHLILLTVGLDLDLENLIPFIFVLFRYLTYMMYRHICCGLCAFLLYIVLMVI